MMLRVREKIRDRFGFLSWLAEFVYPCRCPSCEGAGGSPGETGRAGVFCNSCAQRLRLIHPPWCELCGLPLPAPPTKSGQCCNRCRTTPLPFRRGRAVAFYEGPVTKAIRRLKYGRRESCAYPLADLVVDHLPGDIIPSKYDRLIPVPLHPGRLRERGFNQTGLIAARLGARLGIPVDHATLHRIRNLPPQSSLGADARRRNIRGVFAVKGRELRGSRVLLLDDVYTTGATVKEASLAMLDAGVERVDVLAVARVL